MFYLENNTTFSGSDIKVYAYRNVNDFKDFKDKDKRKERQNASNPLYPNDPFADEDPSNLDFKIAESLEGISSAQPTFTETKIITKQVDLENNPSQYSEYLVEEKDVQNTLNSSKPPVTDFFPPTYDTKIPGIEGTVNLTIDELNSVAENYGLDPEFNFTEKPGYATVENNGKKSIVSVEKALEIEDNYTEPVVTQGPPKVDYSAVQTNKVNPNFIDIVKQGSDKKTLELARKYQQAKANKNRNFNLDTKGNTGEQKPIIELGSLYSITYSSFREKHAVRTLGRVSAKDYTRGQRTIAGSMNFAVFQSHELMDFLRKGQPNENNIVILDQLPKFNLMLVMINEYGGASILHLFGVTISTESQQTSVEDLALMNNVTFYAEDIITIEDVGNVFETSLSMLHPTFIAGETLRFYKKNEFTTLGGLLQANLDTIGNESKKTGKISRLLNRSRGLF